MGRSLIKEEADFHFRSTERRSDVMTSTNPTLRTLNLTRIRITTDDWRQTRHKRLKLDFVPDEKLQRSAMSLTSGRRLTVCSWDIFQRELSACGVSCQENNLEGINLSRANGDAFPRPRLKCLFVYACPHSNKTTTTTTTRQNMFQLKPSDCWWL